MIKDSVFKWRTDFTLSGKTTVVYRPPKRRMRPVDVSRMDSTAATQDSWRAPTRNTITEVKTRQIQKESKIQHGD